MVIKILGILDILAGLLILTLIFNLSLPPLIIIIFMIIMILKGLFIFTGDLASLFDILAAIVLMLSLMDVVYTPLCLVSAFLILQKGLFSLL